MTTALQGPEHSSCREAAIAWYARMTSDEVTAADRVAFTRWRSASSDHEHAYQLVVAALNVADRALSHPHAPTDLFESIAAGGAEEHMEAPEQPAPASRFRPARRAAFAGIAAAVAGLIASGLMPESTRSRDDYTTIATATGQRSTVRLPDGSRIWLNTQTRISYLHDASVRSVRFESGEAYFEIAPNRAAPFTISVGGREVRVVGTAFNIRHIDERTDVAVTEGTVTLMEESNFLEALRGAFEPDPATTLSAGMSASYEAKSEVVLNAGAPVKTMAAWREGRLIYRSERLGRVLADLDRYFDGDLLVRDPAVAELTVSAVVNLTSKQAVLETLSHQLPIAIHQRENNVTEITLKADRTPTPRVRASAAAASSLP